MRINPVKRIIREGGVAIGTMMMEFATTGVGRIAAEAAPSLLCSTWSIPAGASRPSGCSWPLRARPTWCRWCASRALQYHFIARVLDVGAMGVVVPMVADAAQAQTLAQSAKYPPDGRRGLAFGVAHDDYRVGDLAEGMSRANEEVFVIAQIETVGGVAEVEAIAAVDGIDALWIGQYDLTASMGIPGRFDHPDFREATRRVLEACRRHGKVAVLGSGDVEVLRGGPGEGFRMLVYLADLWIYQQALRRGMTALRESIP